MQKKEAVSGRTGTLRGQETVPEHSGSLQREVDESQEEEEGGLTGCQTQSRRAQRIIPVATVGPGKAPGASGIRDPSKWSEGSDCSQLLPCRNSVPVLPDLLDSRVLSL